MVIIYSTVESIINAFSLLLRPFDPKRRVSTIIESFWFNKERLMLIIFSESFSLIWVIWVVEKEVNSCFNMPTAVAEWI